ncbi:MAG: hypothetical protein Q7R92_02750 [bacterium]|nr:hypothetical protein [bacterium]
MKKNFLIEIFQLDNGDSSYLLVPKEMKIGEAKKRLSDLTEEELRLLKATPRILVHLAPRSFADAWGCEPHEAFYGPWGKKNFGVELDGEGHLASHQELGIHNSTNTFRQFHYDERYLWEDAAEPMALRQDPDCSYEQSKIWEIHNQLNKGLGWFTVSHGFECPDCGAPWGPICDCDFAGPDKTTAPSGSAREYFEVSINQLLAGYAGNIPFDTRVRIYPAEGVVKIKGDVAAP